MRSASFARRRRRIVTASDDKTARLWDASSGTLIASLKGHEGAVNERFVQPGWQPDRDRVSDKTARLWDASSGSLIAVSERP